MSEILQVAALYRSQLGSQGLRTLADFFAYNQGDRLDKPGLETWRQRWRITVPAVPGGDDADTDTNAGRPKMSTFYLKRFSRPPLRRQWQRWLSGSWWTSTAGVEWANAVDLAAAGVRAVQPVAFGEEMVGPWERRSFILLGQAPGESLEQWVPRHLPAVSTEPGRVSIERDGVSAERDGFNRRHRLDALARFIGKFHAAGFVHRDLYLCHIFYMERLSADSSSRHEFCLIDLQRVFRPRWWRMQRWVVKDLAALAYSTPTDRVGLWERLRFLCRYVQVCSGRFGSARQLAALVHAKTASIARQRQRRLARQ